MPRKSKNPTQTTSTTEDPKLYAHSYAVRLAKQVAQELGSSRPRQELERRRRAALARDEISLPT